MPGVWPGRALPGASAQPLRGAVPAGVSAALHGMPQAVLLLRGGKKSYDLYLNLYLKICIQINIFKKSAVRRASVSQQGEL